MRSKLCMATLVVWLVTIAAFGWLFVRGWTREGTDKRTEIVLVLAERDQLLAEMRHLLKAVHGIVTGLSGADGMHDAAAAARTAGTIMEADVDAALMVKLPLPFKQMGLSVHQDMDQLADAIVEREAPAEILRRLSSITARCTTCHDMYRFQGER